MSRSVDLCPYVTSSAIRVALGLLIALVGASGCSSVAGSTPPLAPTESPMPSAQTASVPQSTPTRHLPGVILVAPEDDPTATALGPVLEGLSLDAGLQFEQRTKLPSEDGAAGLKIALIVKPTDNLASLADSWPGTHIIAVGAPGLSPRPNLTVIEPLMDRSHDLGFLGGYLAALVSKNWRVASLSEPETIRGATTRLAFANGAEFLCGLCRPLQPPYPDYPMDFQVPRPGDGSGLQALLAEIKRDRIDVIYIQPGFNDSDVVDGLANAGVGLIGVGEHGAAPSAPWIATIEEDPGAAVASVWSGALNGESGRGLKMPLRVVVHDATRLTPGRFRLLQLIIEDLELGFIDTGVDPISGDPA